MGILWASFVLTFLVRFGGQLPSYNFSAFLRTLPWLTIGWILLADLLGQYEADTWEETVQSVLLTTFLGVILAMAISFLARGFSFPRSVLLGGAILDAALELLVLHYIRRASIRRMRPLRLVVIAPDAEQERIGVLVAARRHDDPMEIIQTVGAVDGLADLSSDVADVLVLGGTLDAELRGALAVDALARGIDVYVMPTTYDILISRAAVERWEDSMLLAVTPGGAGHDRERVKRLMDLIAGGLLLLVASPFILAIAVAVRIADGSPVFYRQERMGQNGRTFSIVKFRTMVRDAEEISGPVLASDGDPRVTRLGRWLRAHRLDELPQLWNVVRGDMSLVGPRPERPALQRSIEADLPDFRHRLQLKPGLTGLAQIHGRYDTAPADKLRHDLYYYGSYSPLLDLKVMLRTIRVLFSRRHTPESRIVPRRSEQARASTTK